MEKGRQVPRAREGEVIGMARNCKGTVKSGPRKGKVKKGYRNVAGKTCPVKSKPRPKVTTEQHCAGLVKSGKRRGKLRKGYKFVRGRTCPVKVRRKK